MIIGPVELGTRARAAIVALIAVMVADLVVVVGDIVALPWLDDATDVPALERYDSVTAVTALLEILALVVAAVFFIRWFNAAHRDLDALCPGVRRHDTWWSIGGWFIPIMNLFRPKQIFNDMLACVGYDERQPWWGPVWWGLFLLSGFLGNIVGRSFLNADTVEQLRTATIVDAATSAVYLVGAAVAIVMVQRLTAALQAKQAAVASQPPPSPAPAEPPVPGASSGTAPPPDGPPAAT